MARSGRLRPLRGGAPGPAREVPMATTEVDGATLVCGFCGKNQHEVRAMIAGPPSTSATGASTS